MVAVLACIAAVFHAPVAVMTVIGVTLFAAPGYLLCRLLFGPHIVGLERVAVTTGLVFCVPILGGLLLDAAGVSLDRDSWLGLIAGTTLVCDVALFARRRRKLHHCPTGRTPRFAISARTCLGYRCGNRRLRPGIGPSRCRTAALPGYTQLSLVRPYKMLRP